MLRKRWVAAAALAAAAYTAPAASAETVYGLTESNDLVTFDSATPGTVSAPLDVTLPAGVTDIKGIDVRPATLQVYALGQNGQLFKIDTVTGATTPVGGTQTLDNAGTTYDIDFNPVIDRLRVVSDAEESLVINPNTGGAATVASDITPAGTVTGAAYTNNAPASAAFPGNATTTLLDIDTAGTDRLASQNTTTGALTDVGNLGVDLNGDVGFDISTASTANTGAVDASTNTGYLVGRTGDTLDRFYTVNLTTGAASAVGEITSASKVEDIAVAPPVPLVAVLSTPVLPAQPQQITYVRADRPDVAITSVTISGLQSGERLVGIDRRPSGGAIYGVGSTSRLYTINPGSGAATVVSATPFTPALDGNAFGVDFNPVADRLRVVSDNEQNLRINQNDGVATNDTALTPAGEVSATAYTNPVSPAPGTTAQFTIDSGNDNYQQQGAVAPPGPNGGVQTVVGPLGIDVTPDNGLDIVSRFNQPFAALDPMGLAGLPNLYAVNVAATMAGQPANGQAVLIGPLAGVQDPLLTTLGGMTVANDNVLPAAPTPTPTPTTTPTATPTATPDYTVPTPTPTATPDPPYGVKRKKPGLKVKVRPKNDKKSPFKFTAKGKLILPKGVGRGKGCKGQVRLTLRRKGSGKPLSTTRKGVKKNCSFKVTTSFKAKDLKSSQRDKGKLRAIVRFQGNAVLKAKKVTKQVSYGRKK